MDAIPCEPSVTLLPALELSYKVNHTNIIQHPYPSTPVVPSKFFV